MMFTTVRGRFKSFTGTIRVNEQNPDKFRRTTARRGGNVRGAAHMIVEIRRTGTKHPRTP